MQRYVQTRFLGSGAYSRVYEAIDNVTGNIVALKMTQLNHYEGIPGTSLREISTLRSLEHPNILKILDVLTTDEHLILVFEFLDYDLKTFLKIHKVDVIPLIKQLFLGVEAMHSKNIIHRDLKPQNILVDKKGQLKIADFGLARSIEVSLPFYASEVVTLWYRSPELLKGSIEYEEYIDIWSIGCIIIEMISGLVMFNGRSNDDQLSVIEDCFKRGIRTSVWEKTGDIPEYISDLICGCLEENIQKRFTIVDCLRYICRK